MQRFKSMSPADRLKQGQNVTAMGIQYLLYLVAYTVLTVTTGFYLWQIEVPKKISGYDTNDCVSINSNKGVITISDSKDDYIHVNDRYQIILKIYFAYFITEQVRSFIMVIALLAKSPRLAQIYTFGCLNDCLGLAALIILHVYRFQPSGKYCSGDYLMSDSDYSYQDLTDVADGEKFVPLTLLIRRGRYLLGLVIWVWVGSIFLCIITCLLSIIASKKSS